MTLTAMTRATEAEPQARATGPDEAESPGGSAGPGGVTDWRRWAGRVASAVSACWYRVTGWLGVHRPSPAEARSAERLRRKEIRKRIKERR